MKRKSLGKLTSDKIILTKDNFNTESKNVKTDGMSAALKEAFEFVKNNIDLYDDDKDIAEAIDLSLKSLNTYLNSKWVDENIVFTDYSKKAESEPAPAKPKKEKVKREPKPKAEKPAKQTKQPAAPKAPKVKKEKKPKVKRSTNNEQQSTNFVEKIDVQVTFIKRFVKLDGKRQTKQQILSFLNSLQRAIRMHLIRKTSKYATQIDHIQNELIKLHNTMGNSSVIELDKKDKDLLLPIAGSEKTCPAIAFIKRFISLQGKGNISDKVHKLNEDIDKAYNKNILSINNKYSHELSVIKAALHNYIITPNKPELRIEKQELNGLMGIAGVKPIIYDKYLVRVYDRANNKQLEYSYESHLYTAKKVLFKYKKKYKNNDYKISLFEIDHNHNIVNVIYDSQYNKKNITNLAGMGKYEVFIKDSMHRDKYGTYNSLEKAEKIIQAYMKSAATAKHPFGAYVWHDEMYMYIQKDKNILKTFYLKDYRK